MWSNLIGQNTSGGSLKYVTCKLMCEGACQLLCVQLLYLGNTIIMRKRVKICCWSNFLYHILMLVQLQVGYLAQLVDLV